MVEEKKWITVYKYFDSLEGQLLEEQLRSNNILVKNVSRQDTAFDGIFLSSIGEGILQVREDYLEQAEKIIVSFKKKSKKLAKESGEQLLYPKSTISIWLKVIYRNKYFRLSTIFIFVLLLILLSFEIGRDYFYKHNPNAEKAKYYSELGRSYIDRANYKKAIAQLKQAIVFDRKLDVAYSRLGYAYYQLGNYELAVKYYNKAINLGNDYRNYSGLGSAYNRSGYYYKAIEALKQSIQLNPKEEFAYLELAYSYTAIRDYNASISNLNEALKLDPRDSLIYYGLAANYYYLKQFDKMLEVSKKAIEIDPNGFGGYYNAGLASFKLNSYKEALGSLKKAVELNPRYVNAHYYLAIIYRDMKDANAMNGECKRLRQLGKGDWADWILGIRQESGSIPYEFPFGF